MPQTLSIVNLHRVFSTRNRVPAFRDETLRHDLHACLAGVSNAHGCPAIKANQPAHHAHKTLKEEMCVFFGKYGMPYDEQFLTLEAWHQIGNPSGVDDLAITFPRVARVRATLRFVGKPLRGRAVTL